MRLRLKLSSVAILSIAGIIAAVLLISSYVELNQSRDEIYHLLYEHSSSLLESIIQSSTNTLNSSEEIEDLITERLLDNARSLKNLDSISSLNTEFLIRFGIQNNLYRINIFDMKGNRVLTNRIPEPGHNHGEENINRYDELAPVLEGVTEELLIGLKTAGFTNEERYAVAVARSRKRGAIVVNMDAAGFLEFRKKIGIGAILQQISRHKGIEYIILQDTIGILAANEKIDTTESIKGSDFLLSSLNSDLVHSRTTVYNKTDVFEVTKRFMIEDELIGLYRLGVSLNEVTNVERRMLVRLVIISLILASISIIVLSIIFTTQNLKAVSTEYKKFKTFTSSVLENMSEAVIVFDHKKDVTLFNKSAETLFNVESGRIIGNSLFSVKDGIFTFLDDILAGDEINLFEKEMVINGQQKYLSCSISRIDDPDLERRFYLLVLDDLTVSKKIEDQAKRNEKLSAMGELASGVAHEIRNPINAIGMIAQRLNKEFTPTANREEYLQITLLLRTEVNRINKIITQFLSYSKPIDIKLHPTDIKMLFEELYQLYKDQAKQKEIQFSISGDCPMLVNIDKDLIKQSLMNVIQNAFDVSGKNGRVEILYTRIKNELVIEISDNGNGIPPESEKKIFDLYYTTKKEGNGLGLSIAQKIISQHSGFITVASELNNGTTFKIILPLS